MFGVRMCREHGDGKNGVCIATFAMSTARCDTPASHLASRVPVVAWRASSHTTSASSPAASRVLLGAHASLVTVVQRHQQLCVWCGVVRHSV